MKDGTHEDFTPHPDTGATRPASVTAVPVGAALASSFLRHFENWRDVWMAYREGLPLPAFRLNNGLLIRHTIDDLPLQSFLRIFEQERHTRGGFYLPGADDVIIDVGAHIGMFALYMASLEPRVNVYCVEPSADTRQRLEANILANGFEARLSVLPMAISGRDGETVLFESPATPRRSLIPDPAVPAGEMGVRNVPCRRLDTLLALVTGGKVDFLKLSAGGMERPVLLAAGDETLHRVRRMAVEYHEDLDPGCSSQILDRLRHARFDVIATQPDDGSGRRGVIFASRVF